MEKEVYDKVVEYVKKNYSRSYGASETLIIKDAGSCFQIATHKDGSPLILGKSILN